MTLSRTHNFNSNNHNGNVKARKAGYLMVEGRGFQGRRQERKQEIALAKFIENKDKIIVIPDITQKKKIEN